MSAPCNEAIASASTRNGGAPQGGDSRSPGGLLSSVYVPRATPGWWRDGSESFAEEGLAIRSSKTRELVGEG